MAESDGPEVIRWEEFRALPLSDPNEPEGPFFVSEVHLTCGSEGLEDADLLYEIHVGFDEDEQPVELLFVPAIVYFSREDAALKAAVCELGYEPHDCNDGERVAVNLSQSMTSLELHTETDPYAADRGALSSIAPMALTLLPIGEYQYEHDRDTRRIPNCTLILLAGEAELPLTTSTAEELGQVAARYGISIEFRSWGIKWLDFRAEQLSLQEKSDTAVAGALLRGGALEDDDGGTFATAQAGGIHLPVEVNPAGFVVPFTPIAVRCDASRREAGPSLDLKSASFGPLGDTELGCFTFEFREPEVADEFAALEVAEMIEVFGSSRDPVVAAQIALLLANQSDEVAVTTLRHSLRDSSEDTRVACNAIWALHAQNQLSGEDLREALETSSDDQTIKQATKAALLISHDNREWLARIGNETIDSAIAAFFGGKQ